MGFSSSEEVIECSLTSLGNMSDTGPKTKAVFEKALGRVLFHIA